MLINNAGFHGRDRLVLTDHPEIARQEMEVNYFGTLAMIRAFAPVLGGNGGGAIVNVLSVAGAIPTAFMGGYSPAKSAALFLSIIARAELEPQGTRVTALVVGSVDTRMADHVEGAKENPRDIAVAGLRAMARGERIFDTDRMADRGPGQVRPRPGALGARRGQGAALRHPVHRTPAGASMTYRVDPVGHRVDRQDLPAGGLDSPDCELVGLYVYSDRKVGRDAGAIARRADDRRHRHQGHRGDPRPGRRRRHPHRRGCRCPTSCTTTTSAGCCAAARTSSPPPATTTRRPTATNAAGAVRGGLRRRATAPCSGSG